MKKALHITVTIIIILIASRFIVRIADATVQIDDDIGVLVVLLAVINAAIGGISYSVYRKYQRKKEKDTAKGYLRSRNALLSLLCK